MHYPLTLLPIEVISLVVLTLIFALAFMGSPRVPAQSPLRRALGLVKVELIENDQDIEAFRVTGVLTRPLCVHRFQASKETLTQVPECLASLASAYATITNISANSSKETLVQARAQISEALQEIEAAVAASNWSALWATSDDFK